MTQHGCLIVAREHRLPNNTYTHSKTSMNGPSEMEQLAIQLKERLDKASDASDSDNSIQAQQTNRFNKLKRKARHVARGKLNAGGGFEAGTKVTHGYGPKRRRVMMKPFAQSGEEGLSSEEDEDDAYHGIQLERILAQVHEPADVLHHDPTLAVFGRKALQVLSKHALRTLSTEHAHRVELARLLTAFLGDDAVLVMRAYQKEAPVGTLRPADQAPSTNGHTEDGIPVPVKAVTRGQTADEAQLSLAQDFICPTYDRNLGLPAESAEEARRLLQAALDRSEEYLRCMHKVRAGLLRADRYRSKIFGWCKDSDAARR
jgi:hypothetical protein